MQSPPAFRVTVEPLEEACVIRVFGEVDMGTVGCLRTALDAARREGRTALVDLHGVEFMDSSGLHALQDASAHVERSSWAFFVVRPSLAVRRLLMLTGTAAQLPVVSGPAAARLWRSSPAAAATSNGRAG